MPVCICGCRHGCMCMQIHLIKSSKFEHPTAWQGCVNVKIQWHRWSMMPVFQIQDMYNRKWWGWGQTVAALRGGCRPVLADRCVSECRPRVTRYSCFQEKPESWIFMSCLRTYWLTEGLKIPFGSNKTYLRPEFALWVCTVQDPLEGRCACFPE